MDSSPSRAPQWRPSHRSPDSKSLPAPAPLILKYFSFSSLSLLILPPLHCSFALLHFGSSPSQVYSLVEHLICYVHNSRPTSLSQGNSTMHASTFFTVLVAVAATARTADAASLEKRSPQHVPIDYVGKVLYCGDKPYYEGFVCSPRCF